MILQSWTKNTDSNSICVFRAFRARSETVVDRSGAYRTSRATSLAPAPGSGLTGYTGFYGRQLSLHRETEEARRLEARAASAAASASRSSAAAAYSASSRTAAASSSSAAASRSMSAVSRSTTTQETVEKTSVQRRQVEEKKVSFKSQMDPSIKEGRQSMSRSGVCLSSLSTYLVT